MQHRRATVSSVLPCAEMPTTVVAAASFDDMIAITGYTIFINIAVQVRASCVANPPACRKWSCCQTHQAMLPTHLSQFTTDTLALCNVLHKAANCMPTKCGYTMHLMALARTMLRGPATRPGTLPAARCRWCSASGWGCLRPSSAASPSCGTPTTSDPSSWLRLVSCTRAGAAWLILAVDHEACNGHARQLLNLSGAKVICECTGSTGAGATRAPPVQGRTSLGLPCDAVILPRSAVDEVLL